MRARKKVECCKVGSRTIKEREGEAGRVPCLLTFFLSDVYIGSFYSFVSFYQCFRNAFSKGEKTSWVNSFSCRSTHPTVGILVTRTFNENLYYLIKRMCSS